MRKWVFWGRVLPGLGLVFASLAASLFGQVSSLPFQHAQENLDRIRELVDRGALPKSTLDEAQGKLEDAQDEATLADTLYNRQPSQSLTQSEEDAMVAAASRRVDRAQTRLETRQKLLAMGIISKTEMVGVRNELSARQLVLDLARNRVKLMEQLRQIVADEQRLELHSMENSLIRYDGKADFKLDELPGIERDFKTRFHHDLPVSAVGQTMLHQSLGLDHSNKVDIALNPEQPEGVWLRNYLEKLHISYLAFRSAVAGAATAPHIHIGTGSTRLRLASR